MSSAAPEFDQYAVSRVLGEGGMGLVYLAHDRRTGLPVAIKVMSRWGSDPELQARFLKENRILSSLNHRNIVRCYEITESLDGVPSIVMEYVDGVDFRAFEGRPYPELLPLMIQACMGLAYLRGQDVLHRDLSSNNIFVTLENQTRVTKILDFGVAKILRDGGLEGDVKTRTGQFLGKFAFASPEHFRAATVDWRSDVYSLGVIFHRLLTKAPPVTVARKSNFYEWMTAHETERDFEVVAPPGVPPLPDALRRVVKRMLDHSPEARPQSYEEIIHALDRIQRALPPELEPDPYELRTLPPAVSGRIGSSGPPSPGPSRTPSPAAGRFFPAEERAPSVEESQQRRWPELERGDEAGDRLSARAGNGAAAARFEAEPAPAVHEAREGRAGRFFDPADDFEAAAPAPPPAPPKTELLPPPAPLDATKTATTVSSGSPGRPSDLPARDERPAKDSAAPTNPQSRVLEEKTERLDDVIEKMRQQSSLEQLPPLNLVPPPDPDLLPTPIPPARLIRTGSPGGAKSASSERTPAAPSPTPGRRLVVYGGAPSPASAPPRAPAPAPRPPAPAPARAPASAAPASRRTRGVGIALIVGAIVVLFGGILWALISVLK